jgi:hypothetical protein
VQCLQVSVSRPPTVTDRVAIEMESQAHMDNKKRRMAGYLSTICYFCAVLMGGVYRRESNLTISSSPVTKIMYRFYWRTAIKEKKRNF